MLKPLSTLALATQLGAEHIGEDMTFIGAQIDSRQLSGGECFIALPGERVDGHDFLPQAQAAGAVCALVERPVQSQLTQLVVPNVVKAFQAMAALWLQQLRATSLEMVVAITGSAGKTTTKQLIAAALASRGEVLATAGNLNNHLGVPLTLMALREQHRVAVIEAGASAPGDIRELVDIIQPDIAIVTNAGEAHVEGFGSVAAVAQEKGQLLAGAKAGAAVVLNADSPWLSLWQELSADRKASSFGEQAGDYRLIDAKTDGDSQLVSVATPEGRVEFGLPLLGRHNALNAVATLAVAAHAGVAANTAAKGMAAVSLPAGRMAVHRLANGATVVDDSYNANPISMQAAIQWLADCDGQRYCVFGEMAELGDDKLAMHQQVGAAANAAGIEGLVAVGGEMAQAMALAFGDEATIVSGCSDAANHIYKLATADTTVLVKGSRSAAMERVVESLLAQPVDA